MYLLNYLIMYLLNYIICNCYYKFKYVVYILNRNKFNELIPYTYSSNINVMTVFCKNKYSILILKMYIFLYISQLF